MLEFDLDSWQRKWKGCTGVLIRPDGTLFQAYYDTIENYTAKTFIAHLQGEGQHFMGLTPHVDLPSMKCAVPKYVCFESGMYHSKEKGIDRILLMKLHTKTFAVGINGHTYNWQGYKLNGGILSIKDTNSIDLLSPFNTFDQFDPGKVFGVLSKKVWWNGDKLMWLDTQIGFIRGWDILMETEIYAPFIKLLVGPKCHLSVL